MTMMHEFGVYRGGLHFRGPNHCREWVMWCHMAEAAGHKRPRPDETDALARRFPGIGPLIRSYARSIGEANSDAERREIAQRVREPILREIRRARLEPSMVDRLRQAKIETRGMSKSARVAALRKLMGWR
jgi:hypothetical protein